MKPNKAQPPHRRAFTVIELIVLAFTVVMLLVLLFAGIPRIRKEARLKQCSNNLKQVGLAFRIWPSDSDRFHMRETQERGGTMESVTSGAVFQTFQVMSNELAMNAKLLICPADNQQPAASFPMLSNTNVSYFVGTDAEDTEPNMFLTGDRNLTNGPLTATRLLMLTTNSAPGWDAFMHGLIGNIGFTDGSVRALETEPLRIAVTNMGRNSGYSRNRLAFP